MATGPTNAAYNGNRYDWYKVTWDTAPTSGWSIQDGLAKASRPGAFTLVNEAPFCDTSAPAGPAVRLNWTVPTGAASIQVYRNGVPIGSALNGTASTFLNNSSLTAGQSYTFFIRASNSGGTTDSPSIRVGIPASICTPAPGAFTLVNEAPFCDTTAPAGPAVRLNWTIPTGAASIQVYRNGVPIGSALNGTASTFLNNSSLTAGQSYTFFIRASNSGGTTDSPSITVGIPASICTPAPGAFTLVNEAPFCDTTAPAGPAVRLHWTIPTGAASIQVYRNGVPIGSALNGTASTFLNNSGLTAGQSYTFFIRASNSGGTTDSPSITVGIPASICTPAPGAFTLVNEAPFCDTTAPAGPAVRLNWTIPTGAASIQVYRNGVPIGSALNGTASTFLNNSSLTAGQSYTFFIRASNSGGTTDSPSIRVGIPASICTPAPGAFTLVNEAPFCDTTAPAGPAVRLNWTIPTGAASIQVYRNGVPIGSALNGTASTFLNNSGLTAGQSYTFFIRASNSGGTTDSPSITVGIPASICTPAPGAFTLVNEAPFCDTTAPAGPAVRLNLTIPTGAASIQVYRNGVPIGSALNDTASTFLNNSGLTAGQSYTFFIRASNSGGTTDSPSITVGIPASICTPAPGAFTLVNEAPFCDTTAPAGPAVRLNWTIPTGAASIQVYRNGVPIGSALNGTASTFLNNSGLTAGQSYTFFIRASNSGGTTDSPSITVGIPASICTPAPGAFTLVNEAPFCDTTAPAGPAVRLNWTIPTGAASIQVYRNGVPIGSALNDTASTFLNNSGLTAGQSYTFFIRASNSGGTTDSLSITVDIPLHVCASTAPAHVVGTEGLGLRLRSTPSLSAPILAVMPEGSIVTLLGDTHTADGSIWRELTYEGMTGWAAAAYLILVPSGTTPTPPARPIALRQLRASDLFPILPGASISSDTVVLAATPDGPSAQRFVVQFEVRPSGTAFSDPTAAAPPVQGGCEANAAMGLLPDGGYTWRARAVDQNGVPGPWARFSAGTDFSISRVKSPVAVFDWTPAQVFVGDTVTFTAQAAGQSGLTFAWDLGGAATATGPVVTHIFSQAGDTPIALTVTDSQNNHSQRSRIISVASRDLANRINAAANQSAALLDEVLASATMAADAADYFNEGVEAAATDIVVKAALTAISLGFGAGDNDLGLAERCVAWTRAEYGEAAANKLAIRLAGHFIAGEIRSDFVSWVAGEVTQPGASHSYHGMWVPGLATLVAQKKAEIEQLRHRALAATGSLGAEEANRLVQFLQARLLGNIALANGYTTGAGLPITFARFKSSDESGWTTYNVGQHLWSISAGLLGTALGGMGGVVAGVAAKATQAELDIFNVLASQSADAQLLSIGLTILGQATTTASQIGANIDSGLQDVIAARTPSAPTGRMASIAPFCRGGFRTFNLLPRWFATEAWSDVIVRNTGPTAAMYHVEAMYIKTFTTGELPIHFLGVGERQYDMPTSVAQDGINLEPGQQTTVRLTFLAGDAGLLPEGQLITYTLTARTTDGCYLQDSQVQTFGTTYLSTDGNTVDPAVIAAAAVAQSPLRSRLMLFPGSNFCQLKIGIQNTLANPVLVDLRQDIPPGTVVMDSGGASMSVGQLAWDFALQPGQVQFSQAILQLTLPVGSSPLPDTTASAYDQANANWLGFAQSPVVSKMVSAPPPQIQPVGFIGTTFAMDIIAPIPGVHAVEQTSDFLRWETLAVATNGVGSIRVTDTSAGSTPVRFYRASRQ